MLLSDYLIFIPQTLDEERRTSNYKSTFHYFLLLPNSGTVDSWTLISIDKFSMPKCFLSACVRPSRFCFISSELALFCNSIKAVCDMEATDRYTLEVCRLSPSAGAAGRLVSTVSRAPCNLSSRCSTETGNKQHTFNSGQIKATQKRDCLSLIYISFMIYFSL